MACLMRKYAGCWGRSRTHVKYYLEEAFVTLYSVILALGREARSLKIVVCLRLRVDPSEHAS